MFEKRIGVLGASSLVGDYLLPTLANDGWTVAAFSRTDRSSTQGAIDWHRWPVTASDSVTEIRNWISLLPIWMLPDFFPFLEQTGARRLVALSSTSRFVKSDSSDASERVVAEKLASGEQHVRDWATLYGMEWLILRPTLVYGGGRDKNLSEMARFITRFGFFPIFAGGRGLRQPIHARDVASACASAIGNISVSNRAYDISGADTLTYRDMVREVFRGLGRSPRLVPVPLWSARLVLSLVRLHPRYRHWSVAMLERMGQDLVFDHTQAARDFSFRPKRFVFTPEDVSA